MTWRAAWLALLGVVACNPTEHSAPQAATPVASSAPSVAPVAAMPAAASAEPVGETARIDDGDLESEEHEANPYSESVTLKLNVTPPLKAQVSWGAKTLARLSPGNMDAEIERPRGSGPVDVEIKAEGYLTYHTRLYADRSDKVSVRLVRTEDAPGLFGYRRSVEKSGVEKK